MHPNSNRELCLMSAIQAYMAKRIWANELAPFCDSGKALAAKKINAILRAPWDTVSAAIPCVRVKIRIWHPGGRHSDSCRQQDDDTAHLTIATFIRQRACLLDNGVAGLASQSSTTGTAYLREQQAPQSEPCFPQYITAHYNN